MYVSSLVGDYKKGLANFGFKLSQKFHVEFN